MQEPEEGQAQFVTLNLFQGPSPTIATSPEWMLKQAQHDGFGRRRAEHFESKVRDVRAG
jgi:hypothetical protein